MIAVIIVLDSPSDHTVEFGTNAVISVTLKDAKWAAEAVVKHKGPNRLKMSVIQQPFMLLKRRAGSGEIALRNLPRPGFCLYPCRCNGLFMVRQLDEARRTRRLIQLLEWRPSLSLIYRM